MSDKTIEELEIEIKELNRQLAENHAHAESLMADDRREILRLRQEIGELKNELDKCRKQSKKL
jgi:predicted  nucleic acid-binding Zn-ribbon protein